jgi:hypothetical protein
MYDSPFQNWCASHSIQQSDENRKNRSIRMVKEIKNSMKIELKFELFFLLRLEIVWVICNIKKVKKNNFKYYRNI